MIKAVTFHGLEIKPTADVLRYNGIEQKVLDELAARGMLDRARIMAPLEELKLGTIEVRNADGEPVK